MKIATIQMEMKVTLAENLETVTQYIRLASKLGAELAVFPELTVTGCHRDIRAVCDSVKVSENWLSQITDCCELHKISAFVGAPTFSEEGIRDSYLLVNHQGGLCGESHKIGLTESEKMIFTPGSERRIWQVGEIKVGVIICREIVDLELCLHQLGKDLDLIIWPCFSGVYETIPEDEEQVNYQQAQKVASEFGAHLIQANWANSLNEPDLINTGGSVVISPEGTIISTAPLCDPGLALVELSNNKFEWHGALTRDGRA